MNPRAKKIQLALKLRYLRFRFLSTIPEVHREAHVTGAVLAIGDGTIEAKGSSIGYWPSPDAFDGCVHLEARHVQSQIVIGVGTMINNGCTLISEGPGIFLGERVLVGPRVTMFDSDFHPLAASKRSSEKPAMGAVVLGDEVFVGANAVILRGVTIGDGAVVGAGAVVTRDVDAHTIVAGSPARVVGMTD